MLAIRTYKAETLRKLCPLLVSLLIALLAGHASAKPPHKFARARYYGDQMPAKLAACATCHLTDDEIVAQSDSLDPSETQPWNAFGRRLMELGKTLATTEGVAAPLPVRLAAVAEEDADGDGVPNTLELLAGSLPGNRDDRPSDEALTTARDAWKRLESSRPSYAWEPTRAVQRPVPPVAGEGWARNPIDRFVAAEHGRRQLQPQPEAARHALLRRVSLDLTGLPPTRAALQAFVADESPDAYERVVTQLLDSPRYGERWGRHWMDVWRYSDWAGWGEQVRDSQPHVWRWRDWIIESLNEDVGYDEMLVAMLAADEATPEDREALRATGFLVRNYKRLSREQWLTDTVDHTARAFLGLTLKCAQCHDHMYDLVSQEEHYRFRAIFEPYQVRLDPWPGLDLTKEGVSRAYDADLAAATYLYTAGDERRPKKDRVLPPGVPQVFQGGELTAEKIALPVASFYPALQPFAIEQAVAAATSQVESCRQALAKTEESGETGPIALAKAALVAAETELAALEARIRAERAKYLQDPANAELPVLAKAAHRAERQAALAKAEHEVLSQEQKLELLKDKARDEAQKKLDEARQARDKAAKAAEEEGESYAALGPVYPRESSGRRLALARWIANPENPLTARVAVNHIWARHFGRGLVASLDDLGQNGQTPTHPALLDWLAAEFMQPSFGVDAQAPSPRWSMKHLHRLIVTSATYRLASSYDAETAARDADNAWLWRWSPRRLEAESIRDSVLHVGGSLDLTHGGPELDQNRGLSIPRRSIYFRHAPEKQMLFLQLFDMAPPTECYERRESIVPQQALAMVNSELTVMEARRLARRLHAEAADSAAFVAAGYETVLSRPATAEEAKTCLAFLESQATQFAERAGHWGESTADANDVNKPASDPALRARENLVHVLFNHHEFVALP